MLGLCCCTGFSPVETSWSNSLAPVHGLLIAVASLVVVHRLNSCGAWLHCFEAHGIFLSSWIRD